MKNRKVSKEIVLASIAAVASLTGLLVASTAKADNVKNYVVNGIGVGQKVTVDEGSSALIDYSIEKTGPDCDATTASPVTVNIGVPAGVTASPASLVFTNCGTRQAVSFSAAPGVYPIPAVTWVDNSGSYGVNTTAFELTVAQVQGPNLPVVNEVVNSAPVVEISSVDVKNGTVEGNTTGGAFVGFSASAVDEEDGVLPVSCDATSGQFFGLGSNAVTCTATDKNGATGSATFEFSVVDTTAPSVHVPADIFEKAQTAKGNGVRFAVTATDIVDPSPEVSCSDQTGRRVVSGDIFLGTNDVTCTAWDATGNGAAGAFGTDVLFDFLGFYQPIDISVRNAMKAGSTAPMKFRISDGKGGYIGDLSAVVMGSSRSYACNTAPEDTLEEYATGGTALRYDTTAQQYIFNWQSPKQPGSCWQVKLMLADGTARYATFGLK